MPDDKSVPPTDAAILDMRPAEGAAAVAAPPRHDPYAAFRVRDFKLYMTGNLLSLVGRQMLAVAVEWEIYARTHSATALGLVGLVIAIPVVGLSLPAGYLADRISRKHIIVVSQLLSFVTSLALAFISLKHLAIPPWPVLHRANDVLDSIAAVFERHQHTFHFDDLSIPLIYALLFVGGIARTYAWAARSSFFPTLVPRDAFANAVTWNNSAFQIASVVGPAISGFLVAHVSFACVYTIDAIGSLLFFLLMLPIKRAPKIARRASEGAWRSLAAGVRFVFRRHVILATITLDLFAVLLGGVNALLPIFARDILAVGPAGLGVLRSTFAVGAIASSLVLAQLPEPRQPHAGKALFGGVATFGAGAIVFALSHELWLSMIALALMGAGDALSVFVRATIVQLATPQDMRGRVSAIHVLFVGCTNELGEFRAGLLASLLGAAPAAMAGGIGTLVIVAIWAQLFPQLRRVSRLSEVTAE